MNPSSSRFGRKWFSYTRLIGVGGVDTYITFISQLKKDMESPMFHKMMKTSQLRTVNTSLTSTGYLLETGVSVSSKSPSTLNRVDPILGNGKTWRVRKCVCGEG